MLGCVQIKRPASCLVARTMALVIKLSISGKPSTEVGIDGLISSPHPQYRIRYQIALAASDHASMINSRGCIRSRISRRKAKLRLGRDCVHTPKGAMQAQNPSEKAVRYLGGLRMLKRKPSSTMSTGSASMELQETLSGGVSPEATAHRSNETTTLGTGTAGGSERFEQPGP